MLEEDNKIYHIKDGIQSFFESYFEGYFSTNELKDSLKSNVINKGFDELDGYLESPGLVLIASRPAMGKSSLALTLATNLVLKDSPVLYISMELSNEQIAQSLISHFSQINSYKLRNETFSFEKKSAIVEVSKNLSKLPFYVTDHDYHTTETIKETIAKLFNRDIFIKAVFIDYIQLIDFRNNGDDRGNELIKITRELKKISTDLRIPIVVTSQLSKTVERRRNKRPNLNNIDYSYFLDTLMFLYRDGYYNSETEEPDIAEVIIAKHPDNKLETIELHFNNETSKFTSLKDL